MTQLHSCQNTFRAVVLFCQEIFEKCRKKSRQTRMASTWYGQKPEETFQAQSQRLQSVK